MVESILQQLPIYTYISLLREAIPEGNVQTSDNKLPILFNTHEGFCWFKINGKLLLLSSVFNMPSSKSSQIQCNMDLLILVCTTCRQLFFFIPTTRLDKVLYYRTMDYAMIRRLQDKLQLLSQKTLVNSRYYTALTRPKQAETAVFCNCISNSLHFITPLAGQLLIITLPNY